MVKEIIQDAVKKMDKSIRALKNELVKLRTGRAHPSLLEHIKVDYYGTEMPLSQVSSIVAENSRTLMLTPWEKNMVGPIEKAILKSDLGLNPTSAGLVIRIPLPPLTEARRKDLIRVVRDEAEKARVSIRNIRREANNDLKTLLKEKGIGEDDEKRAQTEIQKVTDQHIAQVDAVGSEKESDLMTI